MLFHGAGSDRDHHTLVAIEAALPMPVRRVNFSYRQREGKRPPDRQPVLIEAVVTAAAEFADELGVETGSIALGGRSMGGRMCSIAVADGLPAAGLVLLSYPLHPPGKPDRLRVEHFSRLGVPCLFLGGERDPFGSPAEFEREVPAIPGPVSLEWVRGAHDPKVPDADIVIAVAAWIGSTFA